MVTHNDVINPDPQKRRFAPLCAPVMAGVNGRESLPCRNSGPL